MENLQEVRAALTRVPRFSRVAADQVQIERLAGLTNRNYKISSGDERFVLRIPGEGTSEYIDRRHEAVAARIAAEAGVNAEVLFFDESDGLMLTRFVDGAATMNAERFKDLGAVARAAQAFRRMHDCGSSFATVFDLFQKMDEYLDYLRKKKARIPTAMERCRKRPRSYGLPSASGRQRCGPTTAIRSRKTSSIRARASSSSTGNMPVITTHVGPRRRLRRGGFLRRQDAASCAPTSAASRQLRRSAAW